MSIGNPIWEPILRQWIKSRLVGQPQHFTVAGQAMVDPAHDAFQFIQGGDARQDDLGSAAGDDVVPGIQLGRIAAAFRYLFQ